MGAFLECQGGGATIFAAREGVQGGHMPQAAHSVSLAAFRLGPTSESAEAGVRATSRAERAAVIAQRESTALVRERSRVQSSLAAPAISMI